jgi:hypothetical protein
MMRHKLSIIVIGLILALSLCGNVYAGPTISGDPATSVDEGTPYNFEPTADDADGTGTLNFSINTTPPWATFNTSNGILSGTPSSIHVGTTNNIIITVTDGNNATASLPAFSITVNSTNTAPNITSGTPTGSVNEGDSYSSKVTATDPDGDSLTYSISGNPSWMGINSTSGEISGTPGAEHIGTTNGITVTVSDGSKTDTVTFNVTVNNVNGAPSITNTPTGSVNEGDAYSFTVNATDPDIPTPGDTLAYSISGAPSWMSIDLSTGVISGNPIASDIGTTNGITVTVTDAGGLTATVTFDVTVNDVNVAPTITSPAPTGTVNQGAAYSFTVTASDTDTGDTLTYSISGNPAWMSINSSTGEITGTPGPADVTTTSGVVVTVTDSGSLTDTVSFDITVNNVNDPPDITSGTPTNAVNQDAAYSFPVTATDPDAGDTLSYSISGNPAWMSIASDTGVISGTPGSADVAATTGITVTVADAAGATDTVTFYVTVNNVNDPPDITSGTPTDNVDQGAAYSFTVTATDPDAGDTLVYSITGNPAWMSIDSSTGVISGTPGAGDVAETTGIVVTVTDAAGATDTVTFNVTVNNVNDPPEITSETPAGTVDQGAAYSFTVNATDPDAGDTLVYSITGNPAWMSIDPSTGVISGTPGAEDVAETTGITVTVTDAAGATDTVTFNVTVNNVNDPPEITSATPTNSVAQGAAYSFTVTATDPDIGDTLAYSISGNPAWMSIDPSTGVISGTPGSEDVAETTGIVVTVTDAAGATDTVTFGVTVSDVNDPPEITSGTPTGTATPGAVYNFTVTATDPDTGDTLAYSISGNPLWMSIDSASGVISGTPETADIETTSGITVTVTDAAGATDTVTFDVTVAAEFTITPTADPGGSIAPDTSITVNQGDTPTFTIDPETDYVIQDVTVDGASVLASLVHVIDDVYKYTFPAIDASHSINAVFTLKGDYQLTAEVSGGGGTIVAPAIAYVSSPNTHTFTIMPDSGFVVKEITVVNTDTGDPVEKGILVRGTPADRTSTYTTKPVAENQTITVTFAAGDYAIEGVVKDGAGGKIQDVSGTNVITTSGFVAAVTHGGSVTVQMIATSSPYIVEYTIDNGSPVAVTGGETSEDYPFTDVQSHRKIEAVFGEVFFVNSKDDAYEVKNSGVVNLDSTEIGLSSDNIGGFRFENITVPQGCPLVRATMKLRIPNVAPYNDRTGASTLTVYAEAIDDALPFGSDTGNISNRMRTSGFNYTLAAGAPQYRNIDLDVSPIVAEIINRPGWKAGNAMVFIIETSGGSRYVVSHDGKSLYGEASPLISIVYNCELKPEVVTTGSSAITVNSATLQGKISFLGNVGNAEKRGFCWSTSPNPTIDTSTTSAEAGTFGVGPFTYNATGLADGTTYYFKAYAIFSENRIFYGNELSFTTIEIKSPTVVTLSPEEVTPNSATLRGQITDTGGATVTKVEICWSISPDMSASKCSSPSGPFSVGTPISATATDLTPGTTYYFRACAENSKGSDCGDVLTFETPTTTSTTTTSIPESTTTTTTPSTTTTTAETSTTTSTTGSSTTTTTIEVEEILEEPFVCLKIANKPLATTSKGGGGSLMFMLDDSTSMARESLTEETEGNFFGNKFGPNGPSMLFDNSDNYYKFTDYGIGGKSSGYFTGADDKKHWKIQWHKYNKVYYNPGVTYDPWMVAGGGRMANADKDNPRSNPMNADVTMNLSANYYTFNNTDGTTVEIPNAHYYICENNQPYLVIVNDGKITYHAATITGAGCDVFNASTWNTDLVTALGAAEVRATDSAGRNYSEARQNFANWFQYYRKRVLTAKAAVGEVIATMEGVQMGIYPIHPAWNRKIKPVGTPVSELLDTLYNYNESAGTPLKLNLEKIGKYFDAADSDSTVGTSPYTTLDAGAECHQAFVIVVTDGYYTDSTDPSVGDADGDGCTNTLADVAKHYYTEDLAPDVDNQQRMRTYALGFGVKGTLDTSAGAPSSWPCPDATSTSENYAKKIDDLWHAAVNGGGQYMSASSPEELKAALEALTKDIESKMGGGNASVSVSGTVLQSGTALYRPMFDPGGWKGDIRSHELDLGTGGFSYDIYNWSANEKLYEKDWTTRKIFTYNGTQGAVFDSDDTYYNTLNNDQKEQLGADDPTAKAVIDYIKGDRTGEGEGGMRPRDNFEPGTPPVLSGILGDIVNAGPVHRSETDAHTASIVYAGANDGMLHAFNADDGSEAFAYIPNLVFSKLKNLANPEYNSHHTYFVDISPYARKISSGPLGPDPDANDPGTTVMVGGLGKGGKGYYALDISTPNEFDEEDVMWEYPKIPYDATDGYPKSTDPDMGFSYSTGFLFKSNLMANPETHQAADDKWLVIFGNGYDSTNAKAVLYILDAETGQLVKKIDTGIGSPGQPDTEDGECNGLSTPLLIDDDGDSRVDFAYAGDLLGNLWKFDLRDTSATNWKISYGGQPLFQAKTEGGKVQPITTKPDARKHCIPGLGGYLIYFGTGRYLTQSDVTDTTQQTIYSVWDWVNDDVTTENEDESAGKHLGARGASSTEGAALSAQTGRYLMKQDPEAEEEPEMDWYDPAADTGTHMGWYYDLPNSGERVISDVLVRLDNLIATTVVPSGGNEGDEADPCKASGGVSFLRLMNACTGKQFIEVEIEGIAGKPTVIQDGDQDVIIVPPPDKPNEGAKGEDGEDIVGTTGSLNGIPLDYAPEKVKSKGTGLIYYREIY